MPADKNKDVSKIEGEIRKANEAIAIRPKTGESLTFLTRKLYNTMLFHAQAQGVDKRRYRMPLRTITRGADFGSNDIGLIKEHLRKMRRTEIEWNDPGKEWGLASLVSEVVIKKEGGELMMEWEYPSSIHNRLLTPLQYTPIALAHQAMMRTHAGLALLEICLRYETFCGRITERQPWEWWYPVLTGNTDGDEVTARLHFYRYFKRDTLKPAIQEVNSLTEFEVELIEHTRGRKVLDLQFKISKKQQQQLNLEQQMFDISLISRMMSIGLKEAEAQKVYSANDENRIRAALDVTEKKVRSRSKPEIPPAYFRAALGSDWLKAEEKLEARTELPVPTNSEPDTSSIQERKEAFASFENLPEKDRLDIIARFADANPAFRDQLRKTPLPRVALNALIAWWAARLSVRRN